MPCRKIPCIKETLVVIRVMIIQPRPNERRVGFRRRPPRLESCTAFGTLAAAARAPGVPLPWPGITGAFGTRAPISTSSIGAPSAPSDRPRNSSLAFLASLRFFWRSRRNSCLSRFLMKPCLLLFFFPVAAFFAAFLCASLGTPIW